MRTFTLTIPGQPTAIVRAFDEDEAAPLLLTILGFEPVACCEIEDDPCLDCDMHARQDAYDRAEESGVNASRRAEHEQESADHERECREGR